MKSDSVSILSIYIYLCVGLLCVAAVTQDFCQWQIFNGTCPEGSVIQVDHALYGRMRFGRCLDRDYGYLGCSVSVKAYVEHRCAGRRRCSIALPDAYLDNVPKPCPPDLKAYLELSYRCIEGNLHIGSSNIANKTRGGRDSTRVRFSSCENKCK